MGWDGTAARLDSFFFATTTQQWDASYLKTPMNHWFSHYKMWLACPEQYRLRRLVGLPFELADRVKEKVEEGEAIHQKLAKRLAAVDRFKPGNSKVLQLYHERYRKEDEEGGPWRVEETWPSVEIAPDLLIAGKIDAFSPRLGMVRDTKVKGRRGFLALDVTQLLWYCIVTGGNHAQLDLIYPPSWERSEWGFERLDYRFTAEQRLSLCADICRFNEQVQQLVAENPTVRNPKSCDFCPYTKQCWDELVVL